ncbi:MAG TPA: hypothetical protein DDW49_05745 [Deltaproteobacteria bacterium]|nr:MAG: hypothetical protein A2048_09785 [Deltaproteobacteria bacterium GWA2_45_12]HBF12876.1 hypothetical protein [Deltaproteobacteria bacterium]
MKKTEIKYFDQRTYKRNIDMGFIKEDEFKSFMKALPNCEGQYDIVTMEDEIEDDIEDTLEDKSGIDTSTDETA